MTGGRRYAIDMYRLLKDLGVPGAEEALLLSSSEHDYNCRCRDCAEWWKLMGPDPDTGKYGPFSLEELGLREEKASEAEDTNIVYYVEGLMPEHRIALLNELTELIPEGRRYALSAYMLGMNEGLRLAHGVIAPLVEEMKGGLGAKETVASAFVEKVGEKNG